MSKKKKKPMTDYMVDGKFDFNKIIKALGKIDSKDTRTSSPSRPEFIDAFGEDHSDCADLPTGY